MKCELELGVPPRINSSYHGRSANLLMGERRRSGACRASRPLDRRDASCDRPGRLDGDLCVPSRPSGVYARPRRGAVGNCDIPHARPSLRHSIRPCHAPCWRWQAGCLCRHVSPLLHPSQPASPLTLPPAGTPDLVWTAVSCPNRACTLFPTIHGCMGCCAGAASAGDAEHAS